MERQLAETPYLTGDDLATADISLYAYTHVAHEGGFDLAAFPAAGRPSSLLQIRVRGWDLAWRLHTSTPSFAARERQTATPATSTSSPGRIPHDLFHRRPRS
ncbi:glutathione S-transferase family protein [Acidihalobacter aeolianus]|uniref:hypothetical protein n=1 Tax=Acidihalobacter aeolianus TaxID=2792603 RepID=UPI000A71A369|nr:hypothetical protein [Acidihalobacter aeolianus]